MWKWFDFRGRRYARQRAVAPELSVIREYVRSWSLNWEDGSRASYQRDLEHLRWLAQAARNGGADSMQRDALTAAVEDIQGLIADDSSFRIDGRMMVPEAAKKFARDINRLEAAQRELGG
ncbi:MAG: hypothetical protein U0637_00815 [Phycisphaerales bacterium]